MLHCSCCQKERPIDDFAPSQAERLGSRWCRECYSEYSRKYSRLHPDKIRAKRLRHQLNGRHAASCRRDRARHKDKRNEYKRNLTRQQALLRPAREGDLVYCIRLLGTEYFKFGKSNQKSWADRIDTYKTHSPFEVQVVCTTPGGTAEEMRAHMLLEQAAEPVRGEWYKVGDPDDFAAALSESEGLMSERVARVLLR